jgi:pimeloyl-ACP methyl ester carboxylesterase
VREILIQGIDSLLGAHFAARRLQNPETRVRYLSGLKAESSEEEIIDSVFRAASQITNRTTTTGDRREMASRLRSEGPTLAEKVDEVWYFVNCEANRDEAELRNDLIVACGCVGAKEFNYVIDDLDADCASATLDDEIAQQCAAQGLEYRIFHTALVLGAARISPEQRNNWIEEFLAALHALKAEIEERSPQYFDFQALRCVAPRNAALNLIAASNAADLLVHVTQAEESTGSSYSMTSPQRTPFLVLCESIGVAYRLSLLAVEDDKALNAVDRVFAERIGDLSRYFNHGTADGPDKEIYRVAGFPVENAILNEEKQISIFECIRENQDKALAVRRELAAELPTRITQKTVKRDGCALNYCVAGSAGTAIVVLNAMGQGLEYWYGLLQELMKTYRVIIWEPRGTVSPPPPFGLTEQVNDVDAVVQQERIEKCHLIGWCTGPKVAIDFYLRRPSLVCSMAFLNGTFKCTGSPEELDSPYEHNLESLCRLLVRRPAMADSVMKTLMARVEEDEVEMLESTDGKQMSVNVLSRMSANLKSHVLAPFKTEETTVNYAHQMVDFWAHDSRPKAGQVHVPVLLVGTEYDQVATPEASEAAAKLFPNARRVLVRGATHYCLYERPQFVAGLLKTFFENPAHLDAAGFSRDTAASYAQSGSVLVS